MKNWSRIIPAVVVPAAVILAGAIVVPLSANAAPDLPEKSPEQVLALLAGSTEDSFTGTVTVSADLGLPDLSALSTGGDSSATDNLDLLTGSHDMRVYADGPTRSRAQVLDQLAERDVVRNGDDVWLYSSDENTVVHATTKAPTATPTTIDPATLAKQAVAELSPSSTLTVTTAQSVAGRDAYTLELQPKATETLVGSVAIAVDAQTGLPLSIAVTARGEGTPAISVAFSSLDLATPSASVFNFTPPKDATVKEAKQPTTPGTKPDAPEHAVTGTGWASVIEISAGADIADSAQLKQLSTAVDGGRLVHTALVNILVTDDGKVLAGSVPLATLQSAAQ